MTPFQRVVKIEEECSGVWSSYGITMWERTFLNSVKEQPSLSARQIDIMEQIEEKAFPNDPRS